MDCGDSHATAGSSTFEFRRSKAKFITAADAALSSAVGVAICSSPCRPRFGGSNERVLVLHRDFQHLRQTFGSISIVKTNARAMKVVR